MNKVLCATVNTLLGECWHRGVAITPLYLQKLLYFYYVEYLNRKNNATTNIQFEAWNLGPVNRDLYYSVKEYRRGIIGNYVPYIVDGGIYFLKQTKVVKHAVKKYGVYTASQLITFSHTVGGAWDTTIKSGKLTCIPRPLIKEDYQLIKEQHGV